MLICFSKLSFSLLSQVFPLSSALLTAHELIGVSPRCVFLCHPLSTPKMSPQKAPKAPKDTSTLSVSSHLFFSPLNYCITCFHFPAFSIFFWVTFVKMNSFFFPQKASSIFVKWENLQNLRDFPRGLSSGRAQNKNKKTKQNKIFCKQQRPQDSSAALMLWFLRCHRFISPPCRNGTLNQEDSFWSQALRDLETCGQSEILRELEVCLCAISTPCPHSPFLSSSICFVLLYYSQTCVGLNYNARWSIMIIAGVHNLLLNLTRQGQAPAAITTGAKPWPRPRRCVYFISDDV